MTPIQQRGVIITLTGVTAKVVSSVYIIWVLLALPSVPMLSGVVQGGSGEEVVGSSGILSSFLLIATMSFSPLMAIFPGSRIVAWLLRHRRYFGVASFSYALVHVVFYFVGLEGLAALVDDLLAPTLLVGWAAFFIFLPMAATSNRVLTRAMGWKRWKMLQRMVYLSAVLVLAHWVMVEGSPGPFIFFGILGVLELIRVWRVLARRDSVKTHEA